MLSGACNTPQPWRIRNSTKNLKNKQNTYTKNTNVKIHNHDNNTFSGNLHTEDPSSNTTFEMGRTKQEALVLTFTERTNLSELG